MEPESAVEASPCVGFASLPRFLALDIFARLPADARLLLALVSPSWRALVAEPSLWACVDLSETSGVTRPSDALLLACSAKARGGMHSLYVCGRVFAVDEDYPELVPPFSLATLLTTLQDNAHSLRHLRALCPPLEGLLWKYFNGDTKEDPTPHSTEVLDDLLHAAPGLTRVDVDMSVDEFDVSILRNGVVSLRRLHVRTAPARIPAFLADARRCVSLSELELRGPLDEPDIEKLTDFALNKHLTALSFFDNELTPAAMPSLTRLLSGKNLTTLHVYNNKEVLVPSPAFCAAVAAAPLVCLHYTFVELFDDLSAGLSLVQAVIGHPTLCHLSLQENSVAPAGHREIGAALGLLVAANSPLITLCLSGCKLGDDGLLPLIDALPHNTHLRRLSCGHNDLTQLAAARLLAAVRANLSLIKLYAAGASIQLVEAEAVVAARAT